MIRAPRAALMIALGALICASTGAVAGSRSLRASLSAAYRAFREPGLLDRAPAPAADARACAPGVPDAPRALAGLGARDVKPASDDDLDALDDPDGAALRALAMPELRVPITRRTMRFVRFFARTDAGRATFLRRYRRAGAYRDGIERALREAGLPEDLLWVAAIESGFDPRAVSPAGAAGLWQFMPKTAEAYGLEQSEWIDARLSLARATDAAVAHLRDLVERFGRWDLALAAYNLGHDGVLRAMDRAAAARGPSERGEIGLAELAQEGVIPEETADYVPQVMAFALVAANRARFGLDQPDLAAAAPLELAELAVPAGTRLRTVARAAGIPTALLRDYNPELLRDRAPPTGGDYLLALPAERVARALALFPAYLDHEVLSLADGDPATAPLDGRAWPGGAALAAGEDDDPLPRRPSSLGQNRLPFFNPPGQLPEAMPMLGNPEALEARLPVILVGGSVGWHRSFGDDPLGLLGGRGVPASSASSASSLDDAADPRRSWKGTAGADPRTTLNGRESAIEKELGFLSSRGGDEVQRFRLPNGVAVELRADHAAPLVVIRASVAAADGGSGGPSGGDDAGAPPAILDEARATITVPPRELDVGIELIAARLGLLLGEGSAGRLAELRRQAGSAPRRALKEASYGAAWLALGEALFPAGHPLEGTGVYPRARDDVGAASDLLLTEALRRERSVDRATIALSGDVTRAAVEPALSRALRRLPARLEAPIGPHPSEERILVEDEVPSPRLLYGWIAPAEGAPDEAALRVAMEILLNVQVARLARALVGGGLPASQVDGRLALGERASVVALEVTPSPTAEAAEVERRLDAEIASFATIGPTWRELALAKAALTLRIEKELARLTGAVLAAPGPRPVTAARLRHALDPASLPRLLRAIEDVDPSAVRVVARRTFAQDHRVVVTTWPRGRSVVVTASAAPTQPTAAAR